MSTISVKLNKVEISHICNQLKSFEIANYDQNISHIFKLNDGRVTVFKSCSMVIQGNDANAIYEKLFHKDYIEPKIPNILKANTKAIIWNQLQENSMGSDEVGVGDFFGGLVIAAAYVSPDQIAFLKSIGVTDSKLLTDQQIIEIFDKIKTVIKFSTVIASPQDYNQMFDQYKNAHIIKAVMHNQALTNLTAKIKTKYFVVMDQFASEPNYTKYLISAHQKQIKVDLFLTQAESQFICVACASIIARVFFLKQMQELSNSLAIKLPLGASNPNIPTVANKIIIKKGIENLSNYCKKHFVTYNKIIGK